MANKLIYISNDDKKITPSLEYKYWLKRLNTQLNESTNQES